MHSLNALVRNMAPGLLAAVLFACGSATLPAADWPQFRGPNRDGISPEKGLLKQWPANGPRLVWKSSGLGAGYSTVSVVGDRIYTAGDRSDASFVFEINARDGKQLWMAKLGKPGAPGWGGFAGPRAIPTVDNDLLFIMDQWGELVCFEAATGVERWRKDMTKDLGGARPEWGFSESPLVDGDKVICTPGGPKGAIAALDRKSGALLWQTKDFTDPAHYSSCIVTEIGGVRQYIQLTPASVVGVSTDGQVLWRTPRRGETAVIPTPICHDGYVYVTSGYGAGCNLFKITAADGKFTIAQVYANKDMENHHGGVILVGECVYGYSERNGWTCMDFKTGAVRWKEKARFGKASLVYADGCFYLRLENKAGTVALIEASPLGYREHGRFDPPNRSDKNSWPYPVISGGKLFLRDQDVLLCYDVKAP